MMRTPCGSNSTEVEEVLWDVPITWFEVEESDLSANWTEREEQWLEEEVPTWLSNKSMQVEIGQDTLPLLNKLGVGYFRQLNRTDLKRQCNTYVSSLQGEL